MSAAASGAVHAWRCLCKGRKGLVQSEVIGSNWQHKEFNMALQRLNQSGAEYVALVMLVCGRDHASLL